MNVNLGDKFMFKTEEEVRSLSIPDDVMGDILWEIEDLKYEHGDGEFTLINIEQENKYSVIRYTLKDVEGNRFKIDYISDYMNRIERVEVNSIVKNSKSNLRRVDNNE